MLFGKQLCFTKKDIKTNVSQIYLDIIIKNVITFIFNDLSPKEGQISIPHLRNLGVLF